MPTPNDQPLQNPPGTTVTHSEADAAPQPRRKSWLRRLFILFVVIVLIVAIGVAAAPTILSTGPARSYALGMVNARIAGNLQLSDWSLSWFSPLTIRGVKINDLENREVLSVDTIQASAGVLNLIRNGLNFGDITLTAPNIHLILDEHNQPSLSAALQPKQPPLTPSDAAPQPSPNGPLPAPRGKLLIRDGLVRLQRLAGAPVEVTALQTEVTLDTLERITAKLTAKLSAGTDIALDVNLKELVADNRIQPLRAGGEMNFQSTAPIDLAPLVAVFAPDLGLAGTFKPDIQATFAQGDVKGTLNIELTQLQTAGRTTSGAAPVNLKITGNVNANTQAASAQLNLTGDVGTVETRAEYRGLDKPITVDAEQLLSAILTGAAIDLPDVKLVADGSIDLVRLQKALPNLIPVREGQQLTGGALEINKFSILGGTTPRLSGTLAVKNLTATSAGKSLHVQPISLAVDATIETGTGLNVARADLRSAFAQLTASGTPANLSAQFQATLAKLQQELGQIFDLQGLQLQGELAGSLALKRTSDERINTTISAQGSDVSVQSGDRFFSVTKMALTETGRIDLAAGKVKSLDIESLTLDVDSQVQLAARANYDVAGGTYRADLDITRADLAFASSRAAALGVTELARYGGTLSGKASATGGGTQKIQSSGQLTARNLTADGKTILEGDSLISWTELAIAPDFAQIVLAAASLTSSAVSANLKDIRIQRGNQLSVQADIDARADLRRASAAAAVVSQMEKTPEIAGALVLNGKVSTNGQQITAVARGGIDTLEVGSGENTFREKRVDLDFDGGADTTAKSIKINKMRLTSTPLTAELAGSLSHYDTTLDAALTGRYDAGWDQLTALLNELVPSTASLLVIKGRTASTFEIKGPLRTTGAQPEFRGLTTGLDIAWDSAAIYGIPLGGVKFQPRVADGQFRMPPAAIPSTTGGALNLGATIDFQSADPTVRIPGTLKVFDGVKITHQLSTEVLSRLNPIFLNLASVEGRIALHTTDIAVPLGDTMKHQAQGTGFMDLGTLNIKPAGLLAELLPLSGVSTAGPTPVHFSKMDFRIKDGRILYDNFTMKVTDDFDMRFYGSVGLDESLDLTVSLPLNEGLLRKAGAKGPVVDMARQFVGERVEVPLVGTRTQPKLDWSKIDLAKILKNVSPEKLIPTSPDKVEDFLKGFSKPQPKPAANPPPKEQPKKPAAPPKEQPKRGTAPAKKP